MNLRPSRISSQGTTVTTWRRRSTALASRYSSRTWTWSTDMTPLHPGSRSGSTSSVTWVSMNSKGCRVSRRSRTWDLMPVNSFKKMRKGTSLQRLRKGTSRQCQRIASIIARPMAWNALIRRMKLWRQTGNQSTEEVSKDTPHHSTGDRRELWIPSETRVAAVGAIPSPLWMLSRLHIKSSQEVWSSSPSNSCLTALENKEIADVAVVSWQTPTSICWKMRLSREMTTPIPQFKAHAKLQIMMAFYQWKIINPWQVETSMRI